VPTKVMTQADIRNAIRQTGKGVATSGFFDVLIYSFQIMMLLVMD
jgi:hypothetical protein